MKNRIQTIFVVLICCVSFFSTAQTAPQQNSVLWEVSGNGLKQPSYLFGTIHMICSKDFKMWPKATSALAKSSQLTLEINMADPAQMAQAQQLAMAKNPLSQTLTNAQQTDLNMVLQKAGIGTLAQMDSFTLETLMSFVFMKSFGCPDIKFYELEFVNMAKERNKPVTGLETVAQQMEFLNQSFTDDQMIAYLKTIDPAMCQEMVDTYTSENLDGIYQMMVKDESLSGAAQQILLSNRNANWVKLIPEMMQKQSTFFAVGSAHLAGEQGIINLLKKAGYTLKPIMN
ncbi:TraB/GumN family protein [Flavobacterium sp. CYK-4]|uniref:TraB/GumN family protein n=1 Tax=Flavobacterium lotistagni TaxID=2709660 RepID=UPI00140845C2|nr:TraB/GumN family protein [Flavobacterium lotistagni]NHM06593.1 TraB/GumN family protein [Flavobacterium lotistagni]